MNQVIFSRTTAGIVVMVLAQVLRIWNINIDDQATQQLTGLLADGATLAGAAFSLYGKVRSEQAKTAIADHAIALNAQVVAAGAVPVESTPLVAKSISVSATKALAIALMLIVPLAGCAVPQSPPQVIYGLGVAYSTTQKGTLDYFSYPVCTSPVTVLACKDPKKVDLLKGADEIAYSSWQHVKGLAIDGTFDKSILEQALTVATAAMDAYTDALNSTAVKGIPAP